MSLIDKDKVIEIIQELVIYKTPSLNKYKHMICKETVLNEINNLPTVESESESEIKILPDSDLKVSDFMDTKEEKDTMINMFLIPKKIKEGDVGQLTIYFQNGVFLKAEISFHKDGETYIGG